MSHEDPRVFSERRIWYPSQIIDREGIEAGLQIDYVITCEVDDMHVRSEIVGLDKRLPTEPGYNNRVRVDPSQFVDETGWVLLRSRDADEPDKFFYLSLIEIGIEPRQMPDGSGYEWPFYFQSLVRIDY